LNEFRGGNTDILAKNLAQCVLPCPTGAAVSRGTAVPVLLVMVRVVGCLDSF
jgi:hypothetical protein